MKLKKLSFYFLALLLVVGVRAQVPSGNKYPKNVNSVERGYKLLTVSFVAFPTERLKQIFD